MVGIETDAGVSLLRDSFEGRGDEVGGKGIDITMDIPCQQK